MPAAVRHRNKALRCRNPATTKHTVMGRIVGIKDTGLAGGNALLRVVETHAKAPCRIGNQACRFGRPCRTDLDGKPVKNLC